MIPDIIGIGTLFFSEPVKNSSLAVYLPLFGISGVVATFYFTKRNGNRFSWVHRLLIVCAVISLFPILNAAFSLFNTHYYARWFYMPILFMALETARVLALGERTALQKGAMVTIGLFLFMILVACLPSTDAEGNLRYFNMSENAAFLKRQVIGTGIMSVFLLLIAFLPLRKKWFQGMTLLFTGISVWITQFVVLYNGASLISDIGMEYWRDQMLTTKVSLPDTKYFARAETDSTSTNYELCWEMPTIHCFLSTVPAQIFTFYEDTVGMKRTVESDSPLDRRGLRAILSARYYIENALVNTEGEFVSGEGIQGYNYVTSENGFDIYENENFIPMGFAYDTYITQEEYASCDKTTVDPALVETIILKKEDALVYAKQLRAVTASELENRAQTMDFEAAVNAKKATACTAFEMTKDGFIATSAKLPEDTLLFFSVPALQNFSAYVDAVETPIISANHGLCAIPVKSGVHEIEFRYEDKGRKLFSILSMVSILVVLIMLGKSIQNKGGDKNVWQA